MHEAFGLSWAGKADAMRSITAQCASTLVPGVPGQWVSPATHALVEGDNLEVLRVLARSYARSVDLVAIDPPYNTGPALRVRRQLERGHPGVARSDRTARRAGPGHHLRP